MKYILDFDRVLFDNSRLQKEVATRGDDHLFAHPALWDEYQAADYLYPDTVAFLQQYPTQDLFIVTAYSGHLGPAAEAYQTKKLADSGIAQYVNKVIIMDGQKAPHVSWCTNGQPAVFVDDKRKYVEEVTLECPHVTCIQLLRSAADRSQFDVSANTALTIPVVTDLRELSDMITKI